MHCSPPLQVVVARSPMADSCAVERCLRLGKLIVAQQQRRQARSLAYLSTRLHASML